MSRPLRWLRHSLAVSLAGWLCAPSLLARPDGYAAACGGCHYGQLEEGVRTPVPNVSASVPAPRVEPGEQVEITVSVESTWPDAVVAGFLILGDAETGVFTATEEGTGNVGVGDGVVFDYAIGHTVARPLVDGAATFHTSWTAPMTTGTVAFEVYAVSSDDGDGMDDPDVNQETNDSFGRFELRIGVGCDLVAYYYDGDGDGYGTDELLACEQPPGYALQGGDCADDDPSINPGAVELCSFVDEDCDGEAMAPITFYRDVDGDGYGDTGDILVEVCTLPDGYASEPGDCAPTDPAIHPGAVEVAGNGLDDNCNGVVDEPAEVPPPGEGDGPVGTGDVPVVAAPGETAPGTTGAAGGAGEVPTASGTAPAGPGQSMGDGGGQGGASGCRVTRAGGTGAGLALGLLVCAGLIRRRTEQRVHAPH